MPNGGTDPAAQSLGSRGGKGGTAAKARPLQKRSRFEFQTETLPKQRHARRRAQAERFEHFAWGAVVRRRTPLATGRVRCNPMQTRCSLTNSMLQRDTAASQREPAIDARRAMRPWPIANARRTARWRSLDRTIEGGRVRMAAAHDPGNLRLTGRQ